MTTTAYTLLPDPNYLFPGYTTYRIHADGTGDTPVDLDTPTDVFVKVDASDGADGSDELLAYAQTSTLRTLLDGLTVPDYADVTVTVEGDDGWILEGDGDGGCVRWAHLAVPA